MLLVGWFAYSITREGPSKVNPRLFYSFVGSLVVIGVSLHVVTYSTIPWTKVDLHGDQYPAAKTYNIVMEDHQFRLPSPTLEVPCGQLAEFDVVSNDLNGAPWWTWPVPVIEARTGSRSMKKETHALSKPRQQRNHRLDIRPWNHDVRR